MDMGRDNELTNLRETSPSRELPAWCLKGCGERQVRVADLLAAYEGRRSKVISFDASLRRYGVLSSTSRAQSASKLEGTSED
jgi:hypothetical protein